jgi:NAD(P)-dependent dehydrogenase (short-subunit alcohol dehydrogenase family)
MTSIAIVGGTSQQGRSLAQRFASAGMRVIKNAFAQLATLNPDGSGQVTPV